MKKAESALIVVVALIAALLVGIELLHANAFALGIDQLGSIDIHGLLGIIRAGIKHWLWLGLLGLVSVLVMAVIGGLLFVGLPTVLYTIYRFINGARGKNLNGNPKKVYTIAPCRFRGIYAADLISDPLIILGKNHR